MFGFFEKLGLKYEDQRRREGLIAEIQKGASFIFLNQGNRLIGYFEYFYENDHLINIASIQIHPEYRNGGILRKLLSKVYAHFKDKPSLTVKTSVHKSNPLSIKLNEKLGFIKTNETKERIEFREKCERLLNTLSRYASID
jgi:ribosomal protein S18 acetylase RimI-like enzyme